MTKPASRTEFLTVPELATAVQYGVPVKIIVSNNSSFGSIRWHRETRYPSRGGTTEVTSPDFALMARSFGATGLRIEQEADVAPVIAEAMAKSGPVLVEVITSQYYVSAQKTLADVARMIAAPTH